MYLQTVPKKTTHLKYNTSHHDSKLEQQVIRCRVKRWQVDKSQVVVQAVEESRNKVQQHNCNKENENYCLTKYSDLMSGWRCYESSLHVVCCLDKKHTWHSVSIIR